MRIRTLAFCSLFAALMCVCAWIGVPFGDTVITLQTFALFLCLRLLRWRRALAVCSVYLLLGAVGLPVFSGFRGGIGMLLGPTGGYLFGFLAAAAVYGLCGKRPLVGLILGLLACYACGTVWFWAVYLQGSALWAVVLKCVVPYVLPDAVKLTLAWLLSKRLQAFITIPSRA